MKLAVTNAVILVVSAFLLAVMPTTVSYPVTLTEAATMLVGVAVMVVANTLVVSGIMRPLERLTKELGSISSPSAARTLPVTGPIEVRRLVLAYNQMIERVRQAQRAASSAALSGQEAERKRLARELHDQIGQRLTLALLQLAAEQEADPQSPRLAQAISQVEQSLTDVRQLAATLRPGVLDDLGLRAALTALCTDVAAQSPIKVHRRFDGLTGLAAEQELAIYRIAQEALTNVLRHSGATNATVTALRQGDDFVLEVSDDGVGPADAPAGLGVASMRERAELSGGRLEIGRTNRGVPS